jgi:hypothetical protein
LEFENLFRQHGFTVQQVMRGHIIPVSAELRQSFAEPRKTMAQEFLEVGNAIFVVRRN